jgi:hypothetical protein
MYRELRDVRRALELKKIESRTANHDFYIARPVYAGNTSITEDLIFEVENSNTKSMSSYKSDMKR